MTKTDKIKQLLTFMATNSLTLQEVLVYQLQDRKQQIIALLPTATKQTKAPLEAELAEVREQLLAYGY